MENDPSILIASLDRDEAALLTDIIVSAGYRSRTCHTLADMMKILADSSYMAVVLDIDSLDIGNRAIRSLTLAYPDVCFLCTSRDRFHPELKEALCYHIFTCINKPVDPDELVYWIRCIRENQADTRDPPDKDQGGK